MRRNDLISYAIAFTSFLIRKVDNIEAVILFGSVARGDFDETSDIDLFVLTEENERKIEETLKLFRISQEREKFLTLGVTNDISLKIGSFEEWPSLKEGILDDGIMLYGKYEELPKRLQHFVMFNISTKKLYQKTKLKVWRRLYGYKQRVGRKEYCKKGLLESLRGKKLSGGIIIVPKENEKELIKFLNKYKVRYTKESVYLKQ